MCYHKHLIPFGIFHWVEASPISHPHSGEELTQRYEDQEVGEGSVETMQTSVYLKYLVQSCA